MTPRKQPDQRKPPAGADTNAGPADESSDRGRLVIAALCVAIGTALCAVAAQSILEMPSAGASLMSPLLWKHVLGTLGANVAATDANGEAHFDLASIFLALSLVSASSWVGGAWWIGLRTKTNFADALARWGLRGWIWWIVGGTWEVVRLAAFSAGSESWSAIVLGAPAFWIAIGAAGWLATFVSLARRDSAASAVIPPADGWRVPAPLLFAFATYVVVFVALNWQLYAALLLPHGDSAMYEEHLWNLTHGKGFRSYLDQGLFLGEHIQVIHVLLLPLYLIWPSQLMLELCDSAILAAGCFPVFWIARRHSGDARAATWLAAAYLLYFPLQYLDIAIDLKTFRPNGLGIPVLLFALDQLERRRWKTFFALLLLTLTAQEDYAIVLAPLGIWIALCPSGGRKTPEDVSSSSFFHRRTTLVGGAIALLSVLYLVVATRVVMAWFRNWQEIHYAGYFSRFGKTMPEIVQNMALHPGLLWDALITPNTAVYALALIAPVGFLCLLSPGRLAVALPLFVTLALNEVIREPRHHVHAAAVPFVFWAAAGGIGTLRQWAARGSRVGRAVDVGWAARFAFFCALLTGVFYGLSPLSIAFWDRGSGVYWRDLYVPGPRAKFFPNVLACIPQEARVASTDFVHPRFTHYERSYDYSDYPRAVSNYESKVPDDTDYIVIDTQHPYSKIKRSDQVRELREHPDTWELLPDSTDGYFIVLKRKTSAASTLPTAPAS